MTTKAKKKKYPTMKSRLEAMMRERDGNPPPVGRDFYLRAVETAYEVGQLSDEYFRERFFARLHDDVKFGYDGSAADAEQVRQ